MNGTDRLVATNGQAMTVHRVAYTRDKGWITHLERTFCGLTGYRPANALQAGSARRCPTCWTFDENETYYRRANAGHVLQWAQELTAEQVAVLPFWYRVEVERLRAGGATTDQDAERLRAFAQVHLGVVTGTRNAAAPGTTVTITGVVTRRVEVEGSDEPKKKGGKRRPVQHRVHVAGTGAWKGVTWSMCTRSAAAGRLEALDRVEVTARVHCPTFGADGLGDLVVEPKFRKVAAHA